MLELINISKKWVDFKLENISFSVRNNEYFVILGISGAGKSVILEMISGLIPPDNGKIVLDQVDITDQRIQDREFGLVFQDFAIFPHMNVKENIAYPLKNAGYKKTKIAELTRQYAEDMGISYLLHRMPSTLSGGELQRVALARTLAQKPRFLLLDEPLSSLDVQLKDDIRGLLRNINRRGITVIHVTHDYEEAISLASRIAVIYEGKLIQTGTPKEIFHTPKSEFIAKFTGIKNFYTASPIEEHTALAEGKVSIKHLDSSIGEDGFMLLRSEDVIIARQKNESSLTNNFQGKVIDFFPSVFGMEVIVDIGIKVSSHITQESFDKLHLSIDDKVWVSFKATAVKFVSKAHIN